MQQVYTLNVLTLAYFYLFWALSTPFPSDPPIPLTPLDGGGIGKGWGGTPGLFAATAWAAWWAACAAAALWRLLYKLNILETKRTKEYFIWQNTQFSKSFKYCISLRKKSLPVDKEWAGGARVCEEVLLSFTYVSSRIFWRLSISCKYSLHIGSYNSSSHTYSNLIILLMFWY